MDIRFENKMIFQKKKLNKFLTQTNFDKQYLNNSHVKYIDNLMIIFFV